jgi:ATP-dependent protease ClpP protease subunit
MKIILALLTALALSGCFPDCSNVTSNGGIDGRILGYSADCEYDLVLLEVDSQGGSAIDAAAIGDRMKSAKTDIIVLDQCSSACIMLLSAAKTRIACGASYFGLHQGSGPMATNRFLKYLELDKRINHNIVSQIVMMTPYTSAYWLSPYEAMQYGLIDEIVNCN